MNSKQEKNKVVFWEYISTENNGDIIIKIKSKKAQEELRALVEAGDKKLAKELEDKKRQVEAVTLEDVEEFDKMIAELVDSDAVYVKAGKMTGRNLCVDWDKVEKNNNTDKKQDKQKKQLEAIRVDATFEF